MEAQVTLTLHPNNAGPSELTRFSPDKEDIENSLLDTSRVYDCITIIISLKDVIVTCSLTK